MIKRQALNALQEWGSVMKGSTNIFFLLTSINEGIFTKICFLKKSALAANLLYL